MICLRKCKTTAYDLCFPHRTLLITGLISDTVVTISHFPLSKKVLFKNSFIIMRVFYNYK